MENVPLSFLVFGFATLFSMAARRQSLLQAQALTRNCLRDRFLGAIALRIRPPLRRRLEPRLARLINSVSASTSSALRQPPCRSRPHQIACLDFSCGVIGGRTHLFVLSDFGNSIISSSRKFGVGFGIHGVMIPPFLRDQAVARANSRSRRADAQCNRDPDHHDRQIARGFLIGQLIFLISDIVSCKSVRTAQFGRDRILPGRLSHLRLGRTLSLFGFIRRHGTHRVTTGA